MCSTTSLKLNGLFFQWETNCPKREDWYGKPRTDMESLKAHCVSDRAFKPRTLGSNLRRMMARNIHANFDIMYANGDHLPSCNISTRTRFPFLRSRLYHSPLNTPFVFNKSETRYPSLTSIPPGSLKSPVCPPRTYLPSAPITPTPSRQAQRTGTTNEHNERAQRTGTTNRHLPDSVEQPILQHLSQQAMNLLA